MGQEQRPAHDDESTTTDDDTSPQYVDDEQERRGGAPMSATVGALDGSAAVGTREVSEASGDDSMLTPDDNPQH